MVFDKSISLIIMDKRNLAFDRTNFILLAVCMAIVIVGFVLMSGPGPTEDVYNPDIFSARRIKGAPVVCLVGFVGMVYAIIRKPKSVAGEAIESVEPTQEATAE